MNRNKRLEFFMVYGIVFALYLFLFLMLPFKKLVGSWISFGFTIFAFLGSFIIFYLSFTKNTLKEKFYSYPLFKLSISIIVVQLVVCIVVCLLCCFVSLPIWLVLTIEIVEYAIFGICYCLKKYTKETIIQLENETKQNINSMKKIKLKADEVTGYLQLCEKQLQIELSKLLENIKFSDPVSSKDTEELENEIYRNLETIINCLQTKNIEKLSQIIKDTNLIVYNRNNICKKCK